MLGPSQNVCEKAHTMTQAAINLNETNGEKRG